MSDVTAFEAMAANVAALVSTVNASAADAAALSSINQKLDALFNSVSSTTAVSAVTTPRVITAELTANDLSNLRGMDCNTGKLISGLDYLRQRITDALLTPQHSQCLLRDRGSDLIDMIDRPMNPLMIAGWIATVSAALSDKLAGVPDFILSRVAIVDASAAGQLGLALSGEWLGNDVEVTV